MPRPPLKSLDATLRLLGNDFHFKLYSRRLPLGDAATIDYYWIDSRPLRMGTDAGLANFRACVGLWWMAMHDAGVADELEQQVHFVTALCYPLITKCKGLQNIYLDAHLARSRVKLAGPLPEDVHLQIQDVVKSRDRFQIQKELDGVLGRFEPTARALPLLQEAFRCWVGKGVVLLRKRGNDGLKNEFFPEVNYWLSKFRKRSDPLVRHFINMFAYEAKVAFYRCYANAWVALIPWLREHHGLDEISERFLRLWHHQNQPVEIPHGRTAGGIYYLTRGRATLMDKGQSGKPVSRSLTWETQQLGPTHLRDVFSGQVLSLHPLSAFFMQNPSACAIAGRFFTCDRYEDVIVRGHAERCSEYWDLIGAILTAAHRYRRALDEQADQRPVRASRSMALANVSCDTGELSEAVAMEDFAAEMKVSCPNCKGALRFDSYDPLSESGGQPQANYRCASCQHPVRMPLDESILSRFLFDRQ
jgi:hypothetical protein